jgi:hypothetical protein
MVEPPRNLGKRDARRGAEADARQSRWRVPVQRTLADAKLDVERAALRLRLPRAYNVTGTPIAAGIVFAVLATIFAVGAALHYRGLSRAVPATDVQERTVDVELE